MMAKTFACKDIGLECDFKADAESEEELMQKIAEHAKAAHDMEQIDEGTMEKVKAAIKDEPAEESAEGTEESEAESEEEAPAESAA